MYQLLHIALSSKFFWFSTCYNCFGHVTSRRSYISSNIGSLFFKSCIRFMFVLVHHFLNWNPHLYYGSFSWFHHSKCGNRTQSHHIVRQCTSWNWDQAYLWLDHWINSTLLDVIVLHKLMFDLRMMRPSFYNALDKSNLYWTKYSLSITLGKLTTLRIWCEHPWFWHHFHHLDASGWIITT